MMMDSSSPVVNEWVDHTSFTSDEYAVSSITYDNYSDLAWVSHENGRLSSFSILNSNVDDDDQQQQQSYGPELKRYSSFMVSDEYVAQVLPNINNMVSVSQSQIGLHSYGGLPFGTITCPGIEEVEYSMHSFSSADLIRDPAVTIRYSETTPLSHIIAGTTSSMGYIFDLNLVSGVNSVKPYMTYDLKSPVVKVISNGYMLIAAGYDGSIRLLDGKFRSNNIVKTLEGHSGVINDVSVSPDGRALITCGLSARKINPYDPNSPSQYANDPVIKVFDLRMQRQLAALPVSIPPSRAHSASVAAAVKYLKFTPVYTASLGKSPDVISETTACVMMGTADGTIQLSNFDSNCLPSKGQRSLATEPVASTQLLYAPLQAPSSSYGGANSSKDEKVTAAAVSASGELMAVGSSFGTFFQYMKPKILHMRDDGTPKLENVKVNVNSPAPKHAPAYPAPAPLLSLPLQSLVLGSSYTLNGPVGTPPVCSSFAATPALLSKRLQLTSARQVHPELLNRAHKQDFIGIIANPGFSANSLLFNAHPCGKQPYATCDPRKEGAAGFVSSSGGTAGGGSANSPMGSGSGGGVDDRDVIDGEASALSMITVTFNADGTPVDTASVNALSPTAYSNSTTNNNVSNNSSVTTEDGTAASSAVSPVPSTTATASSISSSSSSSSAMTIPWKFKRPLSYRGKARMKQFNYWALNKTPYVGLENSTNNSYANSILQFLYSFPAVCRHAMLAQLSTYQQSQGSTLWIELGFLFHMVSEIERRSAASTTTTTSKDEPATTTSVAVTSTAASSSSTANSTSSSTTILPVVTPSNFHRAFQVVPEAVALGLMDSDGPSGVVGRKEGLQQVIQIFTRFMLNQLSKESEAQSRFNGPVTAAGSSSAGTSTGSGFATASTPITTAAAVVGSGGSSSSPTSNRATNGPMALSAPAAGSHVGAAAAAGYTSSNTVGSGSVVTTTTTTSSSVTSLNTIDQLFGFSLRTTTTFLHSRITEVAAAIRATSVDLVYPSGAKKTVSAAPAPALAGAGAGRAAGAGGGRSESFSAVLWASLQKESFMKGWCSASEQYEPFKQVRTLASLPRVLTLLCGDTQCAMSSSSGSSSGSSSSSTSAAPQQDFPAGMLSDDGKALEQQQKDKDTAAATATTSSSSSSKMSVTAHSLFWSTSGDPRKGLSEASSSSATAYRWLPVEIEIAFCNQPSQAQQRAQQQQLQPMDSAAASVGLGDSRRAASAAAGGQLIISSRCVFYPAENSSSSSSIAGGAGSAGLEEEECWVVFDGLNKEQWGFRPASESLKLQDSRQQNGDGEEEQWTIERFNLCTVVSQVLVSSSSSSSTGASGGSAASHSVLHQLRPVSTSGQQQQKQQQWYLFNDFIVQPASVREVLSFDSWRHPCVVCFARGGGEDGDNCDSLLKQLPLPLPPSVTVPLQRDLSTTSSTTSSGESVTAEPESTTIRDQQLLGTATVAVPESVLYLPSISSIPTIRLQQPSLAAAASAAAAASLGGAVAVAAAALNTSKQMLPGAGELIAFDGEFVSVSPERIVVNKSGQRVVSEEARQVLARMSLLDGRQHGSSSSTAIIPASSTASPSGLSSPGLEPGTPGSGGGLTSINSGSLENLLTAAKQQQASARSGAAGTVSGMTALAAAAAAAGANKPPAVNPFGSPPPAKSTGPVSIAQLQLQLQNQLKALVAPVKLALDISPEAVISATKCAVAGVMVPAGSLSSVAAPADPRNQAAQSSAGGSPPNLMATLGTGSLDRGLGGGVGSNAPQSPPTLSGLGSIHNPFNKNMLRVLADDYILPLEPVVDYVTRFSGITMDDLNASTTKHALVTTRTAYLKLRFFIDRKCVFVGHGLQKDFETANIFVPPEQIRDTVELWRLPNQRKISLRFLASYLLHEDIQDEIHDSIEDAKTALLLYRHYEATVAKGQEHLQSVLQELYAYGNKNNWTIGLDKLHSQQMQQMGGVGGSLGHSSSSNSSVSSFSSSSSSHYSGGGGGGGGYSNSGYSHNNNSYSSSSHYGGGHHSGSNGHHHYYHSGHGSHGHHHGGGYGGYGGGGYHKR